MRHAHTDEQREDGLRSMSWALRTCGTGILVGLLLLPASVKAQQAGELDTSFGAGGKVLTRIGDSNEGSDVALQPDGKIVMTGFAVNAAASGFTDFALARYLPDGNLDTSFGDDGVVTTSFGAIAAIPHTVALQLDGKIIAAGYTIDLTSNSTFALARYLPNGSLDTTFSGDGKLTTEIQDAGIEAILLQSDGKIVAVGSKVLARYHPDGTLDTTFGAAGLVSVDFEQRAATLQPDGKIVTAGQGFRGPTEEFALARFLSNGSLDTTFHTDGRVNTDVGGDGPAAAVALQRDGKIVAAGSIFNLTNNHVDFALARYLPDGTLDTTFSGDGRVTTDFGGPSQASAMTLQTDGKIVAAGYAFFASFGMARYLPDGTLDTTFSDDGLVTTSFGGVTSFVSGLVIQPNDRRLVAAGSSSLTDGGIEFALARYESGPVGPPTFDTYRLTRIGETFGLVNVVVHDINENGEMVGSIASGSATRAVLLRDGMVIELGDQQTIVGDINDLTQITGVSIVPDPSGLTLGRSRGFLWEAGQIQDLGIDPNVFPSDINNRGQIVGLQSPARPAAFSRQPFLWEAGRTTFLDCPNGLFGIASAINENGVIVGEIAGAAVMWRDGEVMVLAPTVPMALGHAVDVNDRDEAIGIYFNSEQNEPEEIPEERMSFLWHDGGVTVLPPLDGGPPFFQAHVQSINNEGQIVGFTRVNPNFGTQPPPEWFGLERATLWQEGAVVDLNALISDDDPLKPFVRLIIATKITDSGVILAIGQDSGDASERSYLLTPSGVSFTAALTPPSSSDTDSESSTTASPPSSSSDTDSGGGAVDLLSLLLLILGLSSFARSQRWRCARPFD